MKFKLSTGDALGKQLADGLAEVLGETQDKLSQATKAVSEQAFSKAKDMASSRLYTTKQQYMDSLSFKKVGSNVYSITLDASSAHIEEGYDSFDMKPGLLKRGKNLGGDDTKGIRVSKDGYRYRAIPIQQQPAAAASQHPQNSQPVQVHQTNLGTVAPKTQGSLMKDLKAITKQVGLGGITKNPQGQPILGKVATVTPSPYNRFYADVKDAQGNTTRYKTGKEMDSRLQGVTKFQYEVKNRNGGSSVKSAYVTFRIVSENPKQANKWIHPGYHGAKIFPDLEQWAHSALGRMVEEMLRAG